MRWSVGVRLLVLENAIKIFFTLFSQTLCVAKTAKIPRLQAENCLFFNDMQFYFNCLKNMLLKIGFLNTICLSLYMF